MNDIERLKVILADLLCLREGMKEMFGEMDHAISSTVPVELETDAAGHKQLRDVAMEIRAVAAQIGEILDDVEVKVVDLSVKARI